MKLVFTYLFMLIQFVAFTQTDRDMVRSGNKNYAKDSLSLAIEDYEAALKLNPKFEEAKFNLGDAYYKQGKYADAASTFNELAQTTEQKELKSNAYFNEGNSLMEMQKFENAMTSYKKAMYANPQNADARYNYEYARKMRVEQQKQQQENKDNQDKKDDQNKDNQKDQDKKDQGKDGENDPDKNKKDQNKDDKKDGDQDKDKQDQGDQNKDNEEQDKKDGEQNKDKGDEDQKQPQQPQDQPGQMSQADAERLLKAMEENEKKTREKVALQKVKSKSKKKSEKDW